MKDRNHDGPRGSSKLENAIQLIVAVTLSPRGVSKIELVKKPTFQYGDQSNIIPEEIAKFFLNSHLQSGIGGTFAPSLLDFGKNASCFSEET